MALYPFLQERLEDAKVIVKDLSEDFAYVSVLGSYAKTKQYLSGTRQMSSDETENECGFVIRVYGQSHYSEYSCNDIRGLDLQKVRQELQLPVLKQDFVSAQPLQEEELVKSFCREDAHPLPDQEIMEKLTAIREYCEKYDERIINANVMCRQREVSKIFVSTKKCLDQYYAWTNCMMMLMSREGEVLKDAYCTENEADTALALEELDAGKEKACKHVLHMLEATAIEPGVYDIITDPTITGLIAHEAFGHGVEMDMFVKHRAKSMNYIGKQVASPLVNMHDGAGAVLSAASYFFDDDGVLAHDTLIIKDGILQTGISDALSALELGSEPTGNGRRESYKRKAYTRMTNTFFAPGESEVEDMIKSVKHGYYLCQTDNGMEDPKNWQIQCTAAYGLEIKDGEFTGKIVAPVVISGFVLDLLNSISMVSKEHRVIGSGMCGKGHKEWVFVSDGGPYLKAKVKLG
ncbi:MAG: TldD/PmbA family protein [Erysipelotrichaceae bacterium]|nr:TldD/PmbA family protein [Erysipelotrichaceae bacterium]